MDRLSLSVSGSEGNGSGIDRPALSQNDGRRSGRYRWLTFRAYVNAQSGITLRF